MLMPLRVGSIDAAACFCRWEDLPTELLMVVAETLRDDLAPSSGKFVYASCGKRSRAGCDPPAGWGASLIASVQGQGGATHSGVLLLLALPAGLYPPEAGLGTAASNEMLAMRQVRCSQGRRPCAPRRAMPHAATCCGSSTLTTSSDFTRQYIAHAPKGSALCAAPWHTA